MAAASIKPKLFSKIPKKKDNNKKIYAKANELNKYDVKIHCSIHTINNQFLHKLREKVSPAIILFGKKSVLKKVFNFQFEKNSFIVFTDSENKDGILKILNEESITSYPILGDEGEIIISEGKLPLPSSFQIPLKKYNLNVELKNGDLFLINDFIWKGKIDRNILNLYKILKLKTESSHLKILDVISQ